jgi:transglutaminase superfamily protein
LSLLGKVALAAEIVRTYATVRWGMRREEIGSLVARVRAGEERSEPLPQSARVRLAVAVRRVLALLPTDSRCLVRSLVLLALLERRGVSGSLVIGVRSEPDFAAHAWVECDGVTLLPDGGGQFARLTVI